MGDGRVIETYDATPEELTQEPRQQAPADRGALEQLPRRLQVFVGHYIKHFNGTRAAQRIGYKGSCASTMAHSFLTRADVNRAIDEVLDARGLTPARILGEVAGIGIGGDLADFEPLAHGATLEQLRDEGIDTRLIRKFKASRRVKGHGDEATEYEDVEITLHDRLRALEILGKLRGLGDDSQDRQGIRITLEMDGPLTPPEQRRQVEARAVPALPADGRGDAGAGETEHRS